MAWPYGPVPGDNDGEVIFAILFVIALALGFIGLPIFVWETLTNPPYSTGGEW